MLFSELDRKYKALLRDYERLYVQLKEQENKILAQEKTIQSTDFQEVHSLKKQIQRYESVIDQNKFTIEKLMADRNKYKNIVDKYKTFYSDWEKREGVGNL